MEIGKEPSRKEIPYCPFSDEKPGFPLLDRPKEIVSPEERKLGLRRKMILKKVKAVAKI